MRAARDLLDDRVVALGRSGHGLRSAPRKGIHRQKPVNEQRVAAYERVIDVDELIAEARYLCGISQDAITEALVVADPDHSGIELKSDLSLDPRTACSSARRGASACLAAGGCSAIGCGTCQTRSPK
jgi:coenzyme F420-reducing hydrogenase gamma subunit